MIFDASSIHALVKAKRFDLLNKGTTLDLTRYELGNAVWKDVHTFKEITTEEGAELLKFVTKTINLLRTVSIGDEEVRALELACSKAITFYDAAYVCVASKLKEPLVSEDKRLRHVASSMVETFSMADL